MKKPPQSALQQGAVLPAEHARLRQHDGRWAVGGRGELDGPPVGGHRRVLVLEQWLPAVTATDHHRPVALNAELAAAVQEWNQVGPHQDQTSPPSGLAMHQMLMPTAAARAIHSTPEKATLCDFHTARPRNASQAPSAAAVGGCQKPCGDA